VIDTHAWYDESRPLPELAAELVRRRPAVIVAEGNPPVLALKNATTTVPIVMTVVADPVGSGLVASLARPGGNVTGFSNTAEQGRCCCGSHTSSSDGGGISRRKRSGEAPDDQCLADPR
jgi:ABC-type uncharacterized transport system substrate-binding protein